MAVMKSIRSGPAESARPSVADRRRALAALPDEALCDRCAEGDRLAWSALVERYQRLVYTVPTRAGLREDECEEIFHTTFVKLAQRVGSLRERGRVRAWVVTTARRLTIDAIRSRKTRTLVDDPEEHLAQLPDPAARVDETLVDLEQRHQVRQALAHLDDRCRRLIDLLFYDQTDPPLSYEQVATRMGMPQGSLGPTRGRCLQRLLVALRAVQGDR